MRSLAMGTYKGLAKTRYVNDKQITDHYAIIPTGQGLGCAEQSGARCQQKVYEVIVPPISQHFLSCRLCTRRYPVWNRNGGRSSFFASFKVLAEEGYLKVARYPGTERGKQEETAGGGRTERQTDSADSGKDDPGSSLCRGLQSLKKGHDASVSAALDIKEGETSPPKRYTSGSMILAMENAGQLIEDEELRAQIKGSGIGTSATQGGDTEKAVQHQVSGPEQEDPDHDPHPARARWSMTWWIIPSAQLLESGADGQLGERAELCGGRGDHIGGIHGEAGAFY